MLHLVLIDDHPSVRAGVRSLLKASGRPHQVVGEYGTFTDALADLAGKTIDLVLADYRLPDMHASAFVHRLREQRPGLEVLFLSATTDPGEVKDVLRLGAIGFVSKSASGEELCAAIEAGRAGEVWVSSDALSGLMRNEHDRFLRGDA